MGPGVRQLPHGFHQLPGDEGTQQHEHRHGQPPHEEASRGCRRWNSGAAAQKVCARAALQLVQQQHGQDVTKDDLQRTCTQDHPQKIPLRSGLHEPRSCTSHSCAAHNTSYSFGLHPGRTILTGSCYCGRVLGGHSLQGYQLGHRKRFIDADAYGVLQSAREGSRNLEVGIDALAGMRAGEGAAAQLEGCLRLVAHRAQCPRHRQAALPDAQVARLQCAAHAPIVQDAVPHLPEHPHPCSYLTPVVHHPATLLPARTHNVLVHPFHLPHPHYSSSNEQRADATCPALQTCLVLWTAE